MIISMTFFDVLHNLPLKKVNLKLCQKIHAMKALSLDQSQNYHLQEFSMISHNQMSGFPCLDNGIIDFLKISMNFIH